MVVRFPADGHLVTSSVLSGTPWLREVFYYSGNRVTPAPAGFHSTKGFTQRDEKNPQEHMSWFAFFGTDADAAVAEPSRPETGIPPPGRVVRSRRLLR